MERINPLTGNSWKYGEIGPDGRIFLAYRRKSRINKDGTFQMNWLTCEAWAKRNESCKNAAKRTQKRNVKIIQEEKLKHGCVCCGYSAHACALDFDHIDPSDKIRDIAKMHTTSIPVLQKEMEKCQVLCANCHRIKTHDLNAFNQLLKENKNQSAL
jgi:5-methylcytosine-specific restriction endonuclease McrA